MSSAVASQAPLSTSLASLALTSAAASSSSSSSAAAPPPPSFLSTSILSSSERSISPSSSSSIAKIDSGSSRPKASYPPPPPPWYFTPSRPTDPTTAPVLTVHPRVKAVGGGMPEKFWRGVRDWTDPSGAIPVGSGASVNLSSRRKGKAPATTADERALEPTRRKSNDDDSLALDGLAATAPASTTTPGSDASEALRIGAEKATPAASDLPADAKLSSAAKAATTSSSASTPAVHSNPASKIMPSTSAPAATAAVSSPASPIIAAATPVVDGPAAPVAPMPAPPPPPKPVAKSWAALLRPLASAASSTPAPLVASSNPSDAKSAVASATPATKGGSSLSGVNSKMTKSSLAQLLTAGPADGELWAGWQRVAAEGSTAPGRRVAARGLVNRGNLCFVNSILQVLVFTHEFYNLFGLLGELLPADIAGEFPLLEAMIMFLREFPPATSVVQSGQSAQYPSLNGTHGSATNGTTTPSTLNGDGLGGDAFVPEQVYTAMASIARFDFMRQGHQEDAEEFLGFFLNTLHEEALVLLGRQPKEVRDAVLGKVDDLTKPEAVAGMSAASEQQSGDGWVEIGKKGKGSLLRQSGEQAPTALTRLFTGSNRSTVTIPSHPAVKPSISIEPFSPLQLDIQPAHVDSIESALAHMADPELIPGYALSSLRGGIADAVRRTELEVLPKVLVCHLKRFNWAEGARKMAKVIAFGETLEIPREAIAASRRTTSSPKYKLFGVVYHHGPTVSSGHYTSAVLSRSQVAGSAAADDVDQWLHIDDEAVSPVNVSEVCITAEQARAGVSGDIGGRERCAYLIFYERVE